jgi:pyruvate ferredoxin oxidoreductase alpha subunit
VRKALAGAKRVVVLEKSLAVGLGGIVSTNVRGSYTGAPEAVHTVIAGLGGRNITRASLRSMLEQAVAGRLEPLTFLDLDRKIVDGVLAREREQRRTGPIAESILRELGVSASKTG